MKPFRVILLGLAVLAGSPLAAADQSDVKSPKALPDLVDGLAANTVEVALKSAEDNGKLTTEKLLEAADLLTRIPEEERRDFYRLYRENPEKFRQALAERLARMRAEERQRTADVRQLIVSYHAFAGDVARQQMIRNVLFAAIRAEFERKLTENRRRLDELEEKLNELRREYRFREKNAEAIVDAKVRQLLGEAPQPDAAADKSAE